MGSPQEDILGFTFDGDAKFIMAIMHKWSRAVAHGRAGIPLAEFESVISKCSHAFMSIPAGRGLLTPCNAILQKHPPFIFLSRNKAHLQAIRD